MDIRNILHQKKERRTIRIGQILIGFIVVFFVAGVVLLAMDSRKFSANHFIGEYITVSGSLMSDNNYPTNTHTITNGIISFGLKNNLVNLNNFLTEEVIVNGYIDEICEKYPILEVKSIKIPEKKLTISNDNRFLFAQDLLLFDFSKDIDIYAKKQGGKIVIYYQGYENDPMLSIESFVCNKVVPQHDCEQIKANYSENENEIFVSNLGYTFYKNQDGSWTTFNENNLGYVFYAPGGENDIALLNISHLINIIDSKFLLGNKKELILSGCNSGDIELDKVNELSKEILDENLIKLNISGSSTNGENISCKLNIDIFNDWEITNLFAEIIK